MQFTEKEIQEFKELYYKETWITLSNKEVIENWVKLVGMMKLLLKNDIYKD